MSLGEHNRTGKSNINTRDDRAWPIYPEIAHIPFMIAAPGLEGGREVDSLLQPPDVLPTVAELAGLKIKPPEPLHGRSFAPALKGETGGRGREFVVTGQFHRLKPGEGFGERMTPAVYTERWCYVPVGAEHARELYDIETDPYGEKDVSKEHADVVEDLHAKFVGWLKEMEAPAEAVAPFE